MTTLGRMAGLLACTALAAPARAFGDLNFDATTVTPDTGSGDPLPTGWYNVSADESEKKPTADGTGEYWNFRFTVLDGQYQGRKVYTMFNTKNNNPQTVEIAQKQMSALCHAVGVLKPQQSEQLHNIPLKIRVGQKPASGGYDAGNKITAYKNINEAVDTAGGDAGAAAFGAGAAAAPPPATEAAQPWATGAATTVAGAPPAPPPAAPPAPPPAPPVVAHDPMAAATADGWVQHPSSPPHMYKGNDVKSHEEVAALYPAPVVAAPPPPPVPAAPPAAPTPETPAPDAANGASPSDAPTAPPPWAAPKA